MTAKRSTLVACLIASLSIAAFLVWDSYSAKSGETRPPSVAGPLVDAPEAESQSLVASQAPVESPAADKEFAHSLERSMNYEDLRRRLEPLAEKNDSVALRMLGEAYEYCAGFSLAPESASEAIDALAKIRPENAARLSEIEGRVNGRCRELKGGVPIPIEEVELNWGLAARAGDPAAMARMAARTNELQDGVLETVAAKTIESGDPRALFELGEAMRRHGAPSNVPELDSGRVSAYAVQIAACRRSPGMCGPTGPLMDLRCLHMGACNYSSFEDMVRRGVMSQANLAELDRQVSVANQMITRRGQ
jgi:hypothetical protein